MVLLDLLVDFPTAYNDSVSSVDTGENSCDFYTYASLPTSLYVCHTKGYLVIIANIMLN